MMNIGEKQEANGEREGKRKGGGGGGKKGN